MILSLPLTSALAACVLLCAFLQISSQRIMTLLTLSRISALALAAAIFWQGLTWRCWPLGGMALLILASQVLALPYLFRRLIRHFDLSTELARKLPASWVMLIGLVPVGLAVMALMPMAKSPLPEEMGVLARGLSVFLLGMWLMIIESRLLAQLIGFVTLENGLVLGLINLMGQDWVADAAVMVLLLLVACLVLLGVWRQLALRQAETDGRKP